MLRTISKYYFPLLKLLLIFVLHNQIVTNCTGEVIDLANLEINVTHGFTLNHYARLCLFQMFYVEELLEGIYEPQSYELDKSMLDKKKTHLILLAIIKKFNIINEHDQACLRVYLQKYCNLTISKSSFKSHQKIL